MIHVVSLSGGKDSVALWLWARRTLPLESVVATFADTGNEAPQTYEYLVQLEQLVDSITRIKGDDFDARVRRHKTFPSRVRKWCSPELKVAPFALYLDELRAETGDEVTVLVGFRRDESPARAEAKEREWSNEYDCEVWRPILDWSLADVIAEHHRANVPLNPLYHLGAERVGCWPCIHARKSEIRLIADLDPSRIKQVAALEREIGQTMFAIEESKAGKKKGDPRRVIPTPIHDVVAWSRTERGGKRLAVIPEASGCARWGICEKPPTESDE